jgi:hypothetical protein
MSELGLGRVKTLSQKREGLVIFADAGRWALVLILAAFEL